MIIAQKEDGTSKYEVRKEYGCIYVYFIVKAKATGNWLTLQTAHFSNEELAVSCANEWLEAKKIWDKG